METRTVYSWVENAVAVGVRDGQLSPPLDTAPAIRVWGEVVLRLISDKHNLDLHPALEIRQGALFAWNQRTPLPSSLSESGRVQLQIEVDPTGCAIARKDFVDPLFDVSEWRALKLWLGEQGHRVDLVEEDVMVFEAPHQKLRITDGFREATATRPEFLSDIVRYFEPDALKYLGSWRPLDDVASRTDGNWEVVISRSAIQQFSLLA
ncbi:MAG: hypothetical protein QOD07_2032 [Frankiaceae bacterium]|jgi:hypothetical protein|nr:hypothetical protein [Frankiaceae bacterium]